MTTKFKFRNDTKQWGIIFNNCLEILKTKLIPFTLSVGAENNSLMIRAGFELLPESWWILDGEVLILKAYIKAMKDKDKRFRSLLLSIWVLNIIKMITYRMKDIFRHEMAFNMNHSSHIIEPIECKWRE